MPRLFPPPKDPVMYTGMILENALHRGRPLMTAEELDGRIASGEKVQLIDARSAAQYEKSHIGTAVSIPLESLRAAADGLDKDALTVTYCNKGTTGNAAQTCCWAGVLSACITFPAGKSNIRLGTARCDAVAGADGFGKASESTGYGQRQTHILR